METAQDFMERYLREKAKLQQVARQSNMSLHQQFFTEDYVKVLHNWQTSQGNIPESFVSAEVSDIAAKIITVRATGKLDQRYRYHLAFAEGKWKITSQERACFLCHGTGKGNNTPCQVCDGKGWTHLYRTD